MNLLRALFLLPGSALSLLSTASNFLEAADPSTENDGESPLSEQEESSRPAESPAQHFADIVANVVAGTQFGQPEMIWVKTHLPAELLAAAAPMEREEAFTPTADGKIPLRELFAKAGYVEWFDAVPDTSLGRIIFSMVLMSSAAHLTFDPVTGALADSLRSWSSEADEMIQPALTRHVPAAAVVAELFENEQGTPASFHKLCGEKLLELSLLDKPENFYGLKSAFEKLEQGEQNSWNPERVVGDICNKWILTVWTSKTIEKLEVYAKETVGGDGAKALTINQLAAPYGNWIREQEGIYANLKSAGVQGAAEWYVQIWRALGRGGFADAGAKALIAQLIFGVMPVAEE